MDKAQFISRIIDTAPERYSAALAAASGSPKPRPIQPKQAAEILGVCRRSLLRFEREGKLKRIQVSTRKIRYNLHEVEALATGEPIHGERVG